HLAEKRTAGREQLTPEVGRGLRQCHDPEMVGLTVAGSVRSHVRKDDIGRAAKQTLDRFRCVRVEKVQLDELDSGQRRHREEVYCDDLSSALLRTNTLRRDLAPTAGRSAEIDHPSAFLKQAMLVIDLNQLEGRPAAKTFALGARHIRIVELPLQPELRGQRTFARLYSDLEIAPAAARSHGVRASAPHAPSSRIICT